MGRLHIKAVECNYKELVADNVSEDKTHIPEYLTSSTNKIHMSDYLHFSDNKETDKRVSGTITKRIHY